MKFPNWIKFIALPVILIGIAVYAFFTIRYYKNIHPERMFAEQLRSYEKVKEYKVNMYDSKNDTTDLFYGMPTFHLTDTVDFSPAIAIYSADFPEMSKCGRVIVLSDLKTAEKKDLIAVAEVKDDSGKIIYWDYESVPSSGNKWHPYAFLFHFDQIMLTNGRKFSFYFFKKKGHPAGMASLTVCLYKPKE